MRRLLLTAAATATLAGCADRAPASRPATDPSWMTWSAVGVAAGLAAVLLGMILTWPAWRRGTRSVIGAVLALQAGALWVTTAIMVGAAIRTGQLVGDTTRTDAADALLRLSSLDGDGDLFPLLAATVALVGGLTALLLTVAARLSSGDAWDRVVPAMVLTLEVLVGLGAVGALLAGARGWILAGLAANGAVVAAAVAVTWRRPPLIAGR